jgi:hypothetical protein
VRSNQSLEVVDSVDVEGGGENLIAGAYTLLSRDGTFFRTVGNRIEAWVDDIEDVRSKIQLLNTWQLPGDDSRVVIGLAMTWDGYLAFATNDGSVGVIDTDFESADMLDLEEGEEVSNSIAVDELGGIYVVSDTALYRVVWTGTALSREEGLGAWRSLYEVGDGELVAGRLGKGSGSTPSLMGGPEDKHRFVVITDGQELMHLALYWRDEIPDDAPRNADGTSRRLAGSVPVQFGDPDAVASVSEQSVLVSDYRAVVVSNKYEDQSGPLAPILAGEAPKGIEQFKWDHNTFTLSTSWARTDISCPNGIPTMSRPSNAMYCTGKRDDVWTFEGLDWDTGEQLFTIPTGEGLDYNSVYAATQVGVGGDLLTATALGVVRYAPERKQAIGCRERDLEPYPPSSGYVGVHAGPQNNDLVPCNTAGKYELAWHVLPDQAMAQPNTFSPDGLTTYVTMSEPEGATCTVFALDTETGETRWCTFEPSVLGSSVTVDSDGFLYLAVGGSLVSWTPEGAERWRTAFLDGEQAVGLHFHPSGAIATVTTEGRVLLFDRGDGAPLEALDVYESFGLERPDPDASSSVGLLQNAFPEEVSEDFSRLYGDSGTLLDVFIGGSTAYTDNTIGISTNGDLYAIGVGETAGEGALIQVNYVEGTLVPGWRAVTTAGSAASPAISPDGRWVRVSDGNGTVGLLDPAASGAKVRVYDVVACNENSDSDDRESHCGTAYEIPLSGPVLGAAPVLDDAEHYFWNVQLADLFDQEQPDLVRMKGNKAEWESFLPNDRIWTSVLTLSDRHILGTVSTLEPSQKKLLSLPLPSTASSELAIVDRRTGVLVSTAPAPADSTSTVTVGADGSLYVTVLGLVHGFATDTKISAGIAKYVPQSF